MNLGTAVVLLIVVAICALAARSAFAKKGSCHCSAEKPLTAEEAESLTSGCSPSACAGCASASCCGAAKVYGIND